MTLQFSTMFGKRLTVGVEPFYTTWDIKSQLWMLLGVKAEKATIKFNNTPLEDSKTVREYRIKDKAELSMVPTNQYVTRD